MRIPILAAAVAATALAAPALFNSASDSDWKKWTASHGAVAVDTSVAHDGRLPLRLEPGKDGAACARSAFVDLRPGKHYELSAWVRTEGLTVFDTGRSPIATGASISMASMPFDVHSESLANTQDWTRLKLHFTATRSRDQIALTAGEGGTFRGKAWFDAVSIEEVSAAGGWPSPTAVRTLGPAYRYPQAGWIYLHIEGKPYERGYQHGYLLEREIERYIDRCAAELDPKSRPHAWQNGRTVADALFLRGFDEEIREEMKGIADGAAAAGAKYDGRPVDLLDIVAVNTIVELGLVSPALRMTPTGLEGLGLVAPEYAPPKHAGTLDHCSAFAATGKATRDGHMVVAHTTFWSETLAEQTNIMLDVQPVSGHRVLMQSFPGGIQSGTDWYQNDAGVVLTETTIRQSPFNREGTPVAFRARKAIQYGDNVDKVVEHLSTKNNGLYTNEWLIGDAKNDEIAMFELGTYKTRLWRSSKNEWFAGTEGFYWGCNNAKDLAVRLEYVPDPKGPPEHVPFSPAPRDIKWQELYRQFQGGIDEQLGFLAFRTAPLVSSAAMDAKVATGEMASKLMLWAAIGKPNQRECVPSKWAREQYDGNDGLYPSGYSLFSAVRPAALAMAAEAEGKRPAPSPDAKSKPDHGHAIEKDRLWSGWILPVTDADLWLSAGSAAYWRALADGDPERRLDELRVEFRGAAVAGDLPLSKVAADTNSAGWYRIVNSKGALLLDALRAELGDDRYFPMMKSWFAENTTRKVTTASFRQAAERAAGKPLGKFFQQWLEHTGLPGDSGGPSYRGGDILGRLSSTLIVFGTLRDAGANRYAAEQFQKTALDWFESAAPIRKDFELTPEDLRTHDVVFIGRPESNSALSAIAGRIGLEYAAGGFRVNGSDYASEYDAMEWAAANPMDARRMVLVLAGNTALETVKISTSIGNSQFTLYRSGKELESGIARR